MSRRRIALLGAGGHAKVVIASVVGGGDEVTAVFDDRAELWGTSLMGLPVAGAIEAAEVSGVDGFVVAVGSNSQRQELVSRMSLPWASVVHPSANIHASVVVGEGTVVFAGAVVQPDSILGSHVIVNTAASVDHDCRVGDFVHLAPGSRLAGEVIVEQGCLVGMGSSVLPGVGVGAHSVIGANAAVSENVPAQTTVVGVPAKPLNR